MSTPKNEKEIRGLLGWYEYISRFTYKKITTYEPILYYTISWFDLS